VFVGRIVVLRRPGQLRSSLKRLGQAAIEFAPSVRRTCMRSWTAVGATVAPALLGAVIARSALQAPAVRSVDEKVLREYAGA
jgi:hypothetical protein